MTTTTKSPSDIVWTLIEEEKRRDRALQRIGKSAWIVTILIVLAYAVLTGVQVAEMMNGALAGVVPWSTAMAMATPFITTLGIVSVLIATVATIGSFLRLRTTSLHEIQLRLAALEEMIARQSEPEAFKA
jgi:hypothetical protein